MMLNMSLTKKNDRKNIKYIMKIINKNKISFFLIGLFFLQVNIDAQYSFIYIEDSISFSESNSVLFKSDICEQISGMVDDNNYKIDSLIDHNIDSIGLYVNEIIKIRNVELKKRDSVSVYFQSGKFEDFAFQVYPILEGSTHRFLVVVLKKEYFEFWKRESYFVNDGLDTYYIMGVL
ncbi:MAG: hypothetical protein ACI9N1_000284 [Flavobacteriales bacterium]|jgi:hypothetical protein